MILTIFDVDLHNYVVYLQKLTINNNAVYLQKLIVDPYNEKHED